MQLSHDYTADIEHRHKYIVALVVVFVLIVVGRLYYLQVIKGEFYRFFSNENSIKEIKIAAARGMVFDRRGQLLVENRPSFDLVFVPQYVTDPPHAFATLTRLLGIPEDELKATWAKRFKQAKYQPLAVREDMSDEEVAKIRARKNPWYAEDDEYDLRGVDVRVRYRRIYPDPTIASHVLGYVKEADTARLERLKKAHPDRYFMGDDVGIRGIEETYDLDLKGVDGFEQRIVDAAGRGVDFAGIADQLERRDAIPGNSVMLTIDRDLQTLARDMFGVRMGGAVALDPNDGAVLLMYSAPSYDMNKLSSPEGGIYWQEIAADPKGYLINRTIQGAYPPGSTYKIVTGISALAEGVVMPEENIGCPGGLYYGGRLYRCMGSHGAISYHRSLVQSCDTYYYQMGLRLGADKIAKYAHLLGLGLKSGIELTDERSGLIPTEEWKFKRFGVPWQKGENISISVGQGYDLVTPLQNARMIAQVVNGGYKIYPHLLKAVYSPHGKELYRWKPPSAREKIDIPSEVLGLAKDALRGVVQEGGTGGRLASFEIKMGGKTGTAQVVSLDAACSGEKCRDHAWFVGFAPVDNPEIAMAVVVEHGGFGAAAAAPIVGAVMQRYYDIQHGTRSKHPSLAHIYGTQKGAAPPPVIEEMEGVAAEDAWPVDDTTLSELPRETQEQNERELMEFLIDEQKID